MMGTQANTHRITLVPYFRPYVARRSRSVIGCITKNRFVSRGFAASRWSMSYDLFIGDKTLSSWSLRGWLLFEKFGIPFTEHAIGMYQGTMKEDMKPLFPARTVPVMRTPEGHIVQDTLAMAETLNDRHPDAGMWPTDAGARAFARWITAEMHSGFGALRGACPMNLQRIWLGFEPSDAVLADLARIETLWGQARSTYGQSGPWLFGDYSIADVFYAPVATRIITHQLPVSDMAMDYARAHISDPAFLKWRDAALAEDYGDAFKGGYQLPLDWTLWPDSLWS